jgi:magnesium-transporting ATPase (P-type)
MLRPGSALRRRGRIRWRSRRESGPLRMLIRQVHNPLIYLLAGASVLSVVVGHEIDAAVIAGVIVLNSLLGFIQEWRSEGALSSTAPDGVSSCYGLEGGETA